MKPWHIGTTIVMVALLGGPASQARVSARAQSTAPVVTDHTLESQINARLKTDLKLTGYRIDVDSNDAVVTLGGTVKTEAQRHRAQQLATVMGVKYVRNEIVVDPTTKPQPVKTGGGTSDSTSDKVAGKTKAGVDKALGATKKGVDTAVDKTKGATNTAVDATKKAGDKATAGASAGKDAGQKIGEAFSDGSITAKVKARVEDDALLKNSDVKVATADHVVTLTGSVLSPEGKARAGDIARGTDGVQQVINQLTIQK